MPISRKDPRLQIGRLFTILSFASGSALMVVFCVKLISNSLELAFTDFSLLVAGTLFVWISFKFNFNKLIYSTGGEHRINLIFFKMGIFISSLIITLKVCAGSTSSYRRSLQEGSIIEWTSFLLLLLTAYILSYCATSIRPTSLKIIFYFLSASCFVVAMEEMSWGQMIFNWQTPAEISLINAQGETNFHNIGFIDAHSDFAFGMILAVVISISFLGDKFSRFAGKNYAVNLVAQIAPSKMLLIYFIPACIFSFCLYYDLHEFTRGFTFRGEEEIVEMLAAIGLLGYSTAMASRFSNST